MKLTFSLVALLFSFFSPAQDLQQGLIACYSFTGNANDGTNNHYDGIVHGATLTADRFGNSSSAYSFNGSTSNYISIPSAPLKINNYSYSVWANGNTFPPDGSTGIVISIGDQVTSRHSALSLNNLYATATYLGWGGGSWNDGATLTSSVAQGAIPSLNQWYHLVLTRSDTQVKLYINGQFIGSAPTDGYPAFYGTTTNANIGVRCNYTQPFNGAIDDLSIYNREITQQEVTLLYQNGIACAPSVSPPTVTDVSICGPGSVTITASGGKQYRWYDSQVSGNLLFEGNPFITPVLSATTFYYVSNFQNDESTRVKVTVTVNPKPQLSCVANEIFFQPMATISALIASGTAPFNFSFDLGDGSQLSTSNSTVTYTYSSEGNYTATISVKDDNNCSSTCSTQIEILSELIIPNVITENEDTKNDRLTIFIKDGKEYFPYSGQDLFTLLVIDRWGKEIFRTADSVKGWDGKNVSSGTYYYTISLGTLKFKGWVSVLK